MEITMNRAWSVPVVDFGVTDPGSFIKVIAITSLNSNSPVYPTIQLTANVAGQWINAHDSISKHSLPVMFCNDQGQSVRASARNRQTVLVVEQNVRKSPKYALTGSTPCDAVDRKCR